FNGGIITLGGAITSGSAVNASTLTTTLNLSGGTLDMQGNVIGGASGLLTAVNLKSGALLNVGEINLGQSLLKTTAGALTLSGTSKFTGSFTLGNGTLLIGSNAPNGGAGVSGALGNATSAVSLGLTGTTQATDNLALLTSGAVTVGR